MKYEIVELGTKLVVGKSIITSNSDSKMGEQVGALWQQLNNPKTGYYGEIRKRVNDNTIGLYSDYIGEKYTVTVGAEVSGVDNAELAVKTIAAGKYAKFAIHGNMVTAVTKAWGDICATKLDRTFTGDFEEYLPCKNCAHKDSCNVEKCKDRDINIFIAIK